MKSSLVYCNAQNGTDIYRRSARPRKSAAQRHQPCTWDLVGTFECSNIVADEICTSRKQKLPIFVFATDVMYSIYEIGCRQKIAPLHEQYEVCFQKQYPTRFLNRSEFYFLSWYWLSLFSSILWYSFFCTETVWKFMSSGNLDGYEHKHSLIVGIPDHLCHATLLAFQPGNSLVG